MSIDAYSRISAAWFESLDGRSRLEEGESGRDARHLLDSTNFSAFAFSVFESALILERLMGSLLLLE